MGLTYDAVVDPARAAGAGLVTVERSAGHAIVTLDDPDKLNPLSAALTVRLHDELDALARDSAIRAIVLTGRDPAFSAGGDLRMMAANAPEMLASAAGATD